MEIKLIIGAIVLLVWIANTIKERAKAAPKPPPLPPQPGEEAKPANDLQAFLADVRRQIEEAVNPPPKVQPPPLPPPLPQSEIRRPRKRRRGNDQPVPIQAEPASLPPPPLPPVTMPSMPAMERPAIADVARRGNSSARDAVRLLTSRSTLASAIVLQEVLGPPLAKRPRGPMGRR